MDEKELKYRRKALDRLRNESARAGEGSGGLFDRFLGHFDPDVAKDTPELYKGYMRDIDDMVGHVASEKYGLDPRKYGEMAKLIEAEFPELKDLHAIIDPSDPDFDKKMKLLGTKLGKSQEGIALAQDVGKDLLVPKGIAVGKGTGDLAKMSTALHEGGHARDLGLGFSGKKLEGYTDKDIMRSRSAQDFMENVSKGHHRDAKHFELAKLRELIDGSDGPNKKESKAVADLLKKHAKTFGSKLRAVVPVVGPAIGAAMAVDSGDASAAIPGLDMSDSVGMSAEDEDMMLAETKARMDYEDSPARAARIEALKRMKKE